MRISTLAKTRMVSGALKQWRWEKHPGGANFRNDVNFPQESESPGEGRHVKNAQSERFGTHAHGSECGNALLASGRSPCPPWYWVFGAPPRGREFFP